MSAYNIIIFTMHECDCCGKTDTVCGWQLKQLEKFQMAFLKQILRITWQVKVTNSGVLLGCGGLSQTLKACLFCAHILPDDYSESHV